MGRAGGSTASVFLWVVALAPPLIGLILLIIDRPEAQNIADFGSQNVALRGGSIPLSARLLSETTGTSSSSEPEPFHRHLTHRQEVSVLACFTIGTIIIIAMAILHQKNKERAEIVQGTMEGMLNADRYTLRIWKHFSVKTVQDHIFHGISQSKMQVTVEFENLCTSFKTRDWFGKVEEKTILTDVSGRFEAGHVAAIMGTSGAGKTTFLNVLCGKIGGMAGWKVEGNIKVNGVPARLESLKPITGFVPQDDIVHERMTVRENIWFSAKLRNPAKTSSARLGRITNDVLQVLQLEAQQNIRVGNRATGGGLSGGQRKRVNVGLELAACPTLLFLDEPTSGLDSTGSLMLVRVLQKMTDLGMTIVMVIHQPRYSLFTLIDDVLLLGKGGRTCYFGPSDQAKRYFEDLGFSMPQNENPADWMMDVMSGQSENDNPKMKREDLPAALFAAWEKRKLDAPIYTRQPSQEIGSSPVPRARSSTEIEETEVVKIHLRDAWKRVDPPATTALDVEDFTKVLLNCTGVEPERKVVMEIMRRAAQTNSMNSMGSRGKQKLVEVSGITHIDFERYLLSVKTGFAWANTTEVFSDEDLRDLDDDDEEDEDETSSDETDGSSSDGTADSADEHTQLGKRDRLARRLSKRKSVDRQLPGFWSQMRIFLTRSAILWWRMQGMRLMFLIVVEFAAIFLGLFDRFIFKSPPWVPLNYMNAQISLALLTSVYFLRTFGTQEELPVFWRECSHGLNKTAYFLSRSLVDLLDMFLICYGFGTAYYLVMVPDLVFLWYITPFMFVVYVACSWGYFISCWLPYDLISLGPFVSALLSFVFGGILGLPNEMGVYLSSIWYEIPVSLMSFTRWGVPMIFFRYIEVSPPSTDMMSMEQKYTYEGAVRDYKLGWHLPNDPEYWWTGILALTFIGTLLRVAAFVGLCVSNHAKQV